MSRPGVGNPGNKGGSRKSAYQEHADQALLEKMFFEIISQKEVRKLLASGKYSLKDIFVSKGFSGNERILLAMFNKLFPDNLKLSGDKNNPLEFNFSPKIQKILDKNNDELQEALREEI